MSFAGGFELTILQPTAYMPYIFGAWSVIVVEGVSVCRIRSNVALSVDLEDVAEAVVLVLTMNGHSGETYELVGTSPLSETEVATTTAKR